MMTALHKAFDETHGIDLIQAWGMTETSPIGTLNRPLRKHHALTQVQRSDLAIAQGRPPYGIDLRLVADDGTALAHDGITQGQLQIKGHWVTDRYFGAD